MLETSTENYNKMPLMTNNCAAQGDVPNFPQMAHPASRPVDLVFKNISYSIGNNNVLNDISGMVKPGEMLAIMGPSGKLNLLIIFLPGSLKKLI